MRKIFQLLIFLLSIQLFAESEINKPPIENSTGKYTYQEVITVPNTNSQELYSRAKLWLAMTYRSAQDVIQLDDPDNGKIVAKGTFSIVYYMNSAFIRHTLIIEIKDNRYRYTVTDFIFDNNYWSAPLEDDKKFTGQKKKLFNQLYAKVNDLINGMKTSMEKANTSGTDEW